MTMEFNCWSIWRTVPSRNINLGNLGNLSAKKRGNFSENWTPLWGNKKVYLMIAVKIVYEIISMIS